MYTQDSSVRWSGARRLLEAAEAKRLTSPRLGGWTGVLRMRIRSDGFILNKHIMVLSGWLRAISADRCKL